MSEKPPHFVLIHGACHRAWHWHLLEAKLKASGCSVSTIDLPSCNADKEKLVVSGALRLDIEAIKTFLENLASTSDRIIPVFHSYSGAPGGDAVAEMSSAAKSKIERLVYLTAIAAQPGGTVAGIPNGEGMNINVEGHIADLLLCTSCLYDPDVTDQKLVDDAVSHLVPMSIAAAIEPTQHAPWKQFPCTYIFTTEDLCLPYASQKGMLEVMSDEERKGWKTVTMKAGHSPMLANPDELAKVLLEIAVSSVS
ncbi:hypothetical protein CB0940_06751 [Cercospora beticola]|uniref:AB hydrolase-1 domain-containing protein n=1 Tax=Cercospora beticola TaxID=122368 RepID=A0A2G5H8Q0_CERBT|nr:hypothetical protein CB0940_06751 [Cercospora beticola]PIA88915.1 hypothetical protein CB0940_06751 [Cercospora beticola]WPB02663.1 hypothetical protein RHO25_007299 [Cercospora beticola]CAK1358670.1 unnamed protein product [Cercospora beticola]